MLPADAVVGEVNDGWRVARNTLGNERVHMADQLTFGTGLEELIARSDGLDDACRVRIGALAAEAQALGCIGLRTTLLQVDGMEPGPGASVRKLVQTVHRQKVAELALELLGPEGAVREGPGERAVHEVLMSRCLTIAGGTTQVQLNVVAERLLGLPRDWQPGTDSPGTDRRGTDSPGTVAPPPTAPSIPPPVVVLPLIAPPLIAPRPKESSR